jgi:hypothetical protein
MTTKPRKTKQSDQRAKPFVPQPHQNDKTHVHPDQDRHEPEQDHHEHGNLPRRPGRPGTT